MWWYDPVILVAGKVVLERCIWLNDKISFHLSRKILGIIKEDFRIEMALIFGFLNIECFIKVLLCISFVFWNLRKIESFRQKWKHLCVWAKDWFNRTKVYKYWDHTGRILKNIWRYLIGVWSVAASNQKDI